MRPWRWKLSDEEEQHWRESDYKPTFGGEYFGGLGGPIDWMHPGEEQAGHRGRGPRNYRRPDSRIVEDVVWRLTHHPAIDATDIQVTCHEGEVTLTGTVENRHQKRLAEDETYCVWGVRDVQNRLRFSGMRQTA